MTPGMDLPASLTSCTVSRVPLLAVTRTRTVGLTSVAPVGGTIDNAAGTIGDGRGATCGTGAAVSVVWQWSAPSGAGGGDAPPRTRGEGGRRAGGRPAAPTEEGNALPWRFSVVRGRAAS